MRALIHRFLVERAGATAIEYALIAMIISLAAIAGFSSMANSLRSGYNEQATAVQLSRDRYQ